MEVKFMTVDTKCDLGRMDGGVDTFKEFKFAYKS